MDQRHPAGNPGQSNSAQPQRRLYVYDRPFADIRRMPPQPSHTPTSQEKPQPTALPLQQQAQQAPLVHNPSQQPSLDGFIARPQQHPAKPPLIQQPVSAGQTLPPQQQPSVTGPPAAVPSSNFPATTPESHSPPLQQNPSISDTTAWNMELPDDLKETRSPINARQQEQYAQNNNWHPVNATQPKPPPDTGWHQSTPVNQQPVTEQQFQQNAQRHRTSIFDVIRGFLPHTIKIMAILILISGVVVAVNMIRANQTTQNASGNFNQAESDDLGIFNTQPSEEPASNTGTLGVSRTLDAPKAVKIDAIDLAARVVAVGTSRNSFIKAPSNIYDLGWYEGSAKPGTKGVVLLHGHVSGPTRPGAMYEVALLKRGDVISVERGDGKVYNYEVQAVEFFENDQMDMSKMLTPYNPNRNGLNIMTAGGRYNTETGAYELRAAVYAVEDTN